MTIAPNLLQIDAIRIWMASAAGPWTSRVLPGSDRLPTASDQTTFAAIFAIRPPFGLAAYQAAQPAKRYCVRILSLSLQQFPPYLPPLPM
jgi:hypothetical protein